MSEDKKRWKIVILGDSLPLPRGKEAGDIPYEFTYPYLLDENLRGKLGARSPFIIEQGLRWRTMPVALRDWHEQVEMKLPEVVVVQAGVVDCAPRIFMPWENKVVTSIRPVFLRKVILDLVHRKRREIIKLRPNRVYVTLRKYSDSAARITRKAREGGLKALIYVNTISPPDDLANRSPGFRENVVKYNAVLDAQTDGGAVFVLDNDRLACENGGAQATTVDGVHINRLGHRLLADELTATILKLMESTP